MDFDYLEMMAHVSSVAKAADNGECANLFTQFASLVREASAAFDMAEDPRMADFAGYAERAGAVSTRYVVAIDGMMDSLLPWQLGGFAEEGAEEMLEKVSGLRGACKEANLLCGEVVERIGLDRDCVEDDGSVEAAAYPKIESCANELVDAVGIVDSRLAYYEDALRRMTGADRAA